MSSLAQKKILKILIQAKLQLEKMVVIFGIKRNRKGKNQKLK